MDYDTDTDGSASITGTPTNVGIECDQVIFGGTNNLTINASDQSTAIGTATFPDLTGNDGTVVIDNLTQTLTNKTLTNPTISILMQCQSCFWTNSSRS